MSNIHKNFAYVNKNFGLIRKYWGFEPNRWVFMANITKKDELGSILLETAVSNTKAPKMCSGKKVAIGAVGGQAP